MTYRLDWLQVTSCSDLPPSLYLDQVAANFPGAARIEHRSRGCSNYDRTALLLDTADHPLVTMIHGGNKGARPNLKCTGPDAPAFATALQAAGLPHIVTRIDSCIDLEGEDFHEVAGTVKRVLKSCGMSGLSWVPDDPEKGPTYYAGAPTSDVRSRIYRKDLQLIKAGVSPDEFPQPIVRVEAQIRPKKAARARFVDIAPREVFGASRWLRAVATRVLDDNPAAIVMQKREPTDYEKQLAWLKTQGHKVMSAIYARHPSPELLGKFIIENIINP